MKNNLEFISTNVMTNETAPQGEVLVQYLEPSWGSYTVEFAIGYFDNPNDYYEEDRYSAGWKLWMGSKKINVIAYAVLPTKMKSPLSDMQQNDFRAKFGDNYPNYGSVGGLLDNDLKHVENEK